MKNISMGITKTIARSLLKTKKNSPNIFFTGGMIGIVTSAVLACKATLKLDKTVDTIRTEVEDIKSMGSTPGVLKNGHPYTDQDYFRDLGYIYTKSALVLGRLYGPAIIVGSVSVAALTGSHVQLTRRNQALTVTLAAVTKAYDSYRIRVAEEIGKDRELELHRAIRNETVEIDGKKQVVKITDPNGWSQYARFFDESCYPWQKNAEINRNFLQCQQEYLNHYLQARGHVFLNEVYDALGMERSSAGAVVGWTTTGDGDGHIDFGLFEASSAAFINNYEPRICLDFNVDGVIYHLIEMESHERYNLENRK